MAQLKFLTPGGPVVLRFRTDAELADMVVQTRVQFARDGEANFAWREEPGQDVTYFLIPSGTALAVQFDAGVAPEGLTQRIADELSDSAQQAS